MSAADAAHAGAYRCQRKRQGAKGRALTAHARTRGQQGFWQVSESVPNPAVILVSRCGPEAGFALEAGIPAFHVQSPTRQVLAQLKTKLPEGLVGGRAVRQQSETSGALDKTQALSAAQGCPRLNPYYLSSPTLMHAEALAASRRHHALALPLVRYEHGSSLTSPGDTSWPSRSQLGLLSQAASLKVLLLPCPIWDCCRHQTPGGPRTLIRSPQ